MEYLNWAAEHPILTCIMLFIVFGAISAGMQGLRR